MKKGARDFQVDVFLERQDRSCTKRVEGAGPQKSVGHHGWPTEKTLVLEWPKTAQTDLKFLFFPENF